MPLLQIWIYSLVSVILVSLISFIGVFTLSIKTEKLKKILIYLISFSAGALLGDAFIHLLPEIVEKTGFTLDISIYILTGIVIFFGLEKVINWQHCHHPITENHVHPFVYMNLVGDGFHNLLDGLIIGASYIISMPIGVATTTAIALHEIPQEIGDFGVLVHGGFSKVKALFMNFASSLLAVVGVIIALTLKNFIDNLEIILVALAVGGFIYIASSDLIPELHKETGKKKSLLQVIVFIIGILIMLGLLVLE